MISEVLSSIGGVQLYPIITLLLFFCAFLGVVIWALRMRKQEVVRLSRLPLDDSTTVDDCGEGYNGQA